MLFGCAAFDADKTYNFQKIETSMQGIMQYLFKLGTPNIAIISINIYMVHNQDTEDGMAWFGMMTP